MQRSVYVYVLMCLSTVTELTEGKVDPMSTDASSVFAGPETSSLTGVTDANGSLEEFLSSWSNDAASWDLDFPADILPTVVQPKTEAVDRPLPTYVNATMSAKPQPVNDCYQIPQPPQQLVRYMQPGSGHMHQMSDGLIHRQQFSSIQQGHDVGLSRGHIPAVQTGPRQAFDNVLQPCHQQGGYLTHRPPAMLSHMRPASQRSMPMSNQLHNLQVMVNNQTNMLQLSHVNVSPGDVTLMNVKTPHRGLPRGAGGGRSFQTAEYLPPPNLHHNPAQLIQDQSSGMVVHSPAAIAGFHNQSASQHGLMRGQHRTVSSQQHVFHSVSNNTANHASMIPPDPRSTQFTGAVHGMSPVHHGMPHSSGPSRNPSQQVMMPLQHPSTVHQSPTVIDKTSGLFNWHSQPATAMMSPRPGPNMTAPARNSPTVRPFPPTIVSHGPDDANIDSLSFLSDQFLPQVADDRYSAPQMIQPTSSAGNERALTSCLLMSLNEFISYAAVAVAAAVKSAIEHCSFGCNFICASLFYFCHCCDVKRHKDYNSVSAP